MKMRKKIQEAYIKANIYPSLQGIVVGCKDILKHIRAFQTVPRFPSVLSANDDHLKEIMDFKDHDILPAYPPGLSEEDKFDWGKKQRETLLREFEFEFYDMDDLRWSVSSRFNELGLYVSCWNPDWTGSPNEIH